MSQSDSSAFREPTGSEVVEDTGGWQAGVVAGIAGAAAMGVLVSMMRPVVLETVIPAMYTLSGGVAGWTIHLSHGAVIGVGFVALLRLSPLEITSAPMVLGSGLLWGVLTWIVLAALIMPIWLTAVGFNMAPPFPNFAVPSLIWHLVYGVTLGGGYYLIR